jgi:hypothetical protein
MLGIIIPVIEEELSTLKQNIDLLKENLNKATLDQYKICIVIQTKNHIILDNIDNVFIKTISYYSVSHARNIGLEVLKDKCDYIYLLDQDALPSVEFLKQSKVNIKNNLDIWSGKIYWTDEKLTTFEFLNFDIHKLNTFFIPYNTFLGCYIFKNTLIYKYCIRFNENLGPAEDTYLKTGEDVLFLCELFSYNKIKRYAFYKNLKIFHPKRTIDNYKTLLYLEGQSAIYKYLTSSKSMILNIRLSSFIYIILFIVNGFKKSLFGEENGTEILKKRVQSIFKKYDINNKNGV